jgi:hypothetical protein
MDNWLRLLLLESYGLEAAGVAGFSGRGMSLWDGGVRHIAPVAASARLECY